MPIIESLKYYRNHHSQELVEIVKSKIVRGEACAISVSEKSLKMVKCVFKPLAKNIFSEDFAASLKILIHQLSKFVGKKQYPF
jgi:hypothetical protein